MTEPSKPPATKYRYDLTIFGNSHREIVQEILIQTRGGYLLDSDYEKRDEFSVVGGRKSSRLTHTNPEMTEERYAAELDAWWQERKSRHTLEEPEEGKG